MHSNSSSLSRRPMVLAGDRDVTERIRPFRRDRALECSAYLLKITSFPTADAIVYRQHTAGNMFRRTGRPYTQAASPKERRG